MAPLQPQPVLSTSRPSIWCSSIFSLHTGGRALQEAAGALGQTSWVTAPSFPQGGGNQGEALASREAVQEVSLFQEGLASGC